MSQSVSLVPYTVKVNREENHLFSDTADEIAAAEIQYLNILQEYFQSRIENKSVDTEKQKMMRVSKVDVDADRNYVCGILKTGNYGYSAELENVDTGATKMRNVDDCELLPFFFRFDFKKGKDSGILLLERYGIYGAKTALEDDFKSFLSEQYPELKLQLKPIVDPEVIEQMFAGRLKEIQFISRQIPKDIADKIKLDVTETQGTLRMVLRAKHRQRFMPSFLDFLRPLYQDGGCVEIQDVKYNDAQLVVSVDGKRRTICLTELDRLRSMPLDVTSEVTIDDNGHPTFHSIAAKAEEIVPSFKRTLGW